MASSPARRRPVLEKQSTETDQFTKEWHDKRNEIQESVYYFKDLLRDKKKRDQLLRKHKIKQGAGDSSPGIAVHGSIVKLMNYENRCVNTTEEVGSVLGIKVGDDFFNYRGELYVAGLHRNLINGIHYSRALDDELEAFSIVDSGRYQPLHSRPGIWYCGEGEGSKTPVRGNKALINNAKNKKPVRYIRKYGIVGGEYKDKFKYEGLYRIKKYEKIQEKTNGDGVYIFNLEKMKDEVQYRPEWKMSNTSPSRTGAQGN